MPKAKSDIPALPAVIYARYSSHNQREESIEQQIAECTAYAKLNNYRVIEIYSDAAVSGRSDQRTQFQRMLRDAERGHYRVVIAYKSNRIARNMLNALQYEAKLETFGVRTVYAKEEFGDSAAGRFALRTMMNVNQFYSENMAEDIKRGLMDNAQECKVNCVLAYGYKKGSDGRYAVEPYEAEIVREVFRRYLSGEMFVSISEDLNARGVRTRRGGRWNKGSFHRMLRNENYIGVYRYNGTRIEGGVPPIIEREVFYRVQRKLEERLSSPARRREKAEYLLTGKLLCGECGAYMVGLSGTSRRGSLHYYYVCQSKRTKKTCKKENVRRDYIEQRVTEITREIILRDEIIDWIADSAVKVQNDALAGSDVSRIESELREERKSQRNVLNAIKAGIITDSTKDLLTGIELNISELEGALAVAKAQSIPYDKERIVFALRQLRDGDCADKKYQKMIIESFVRSVTIYDDGRARIDYYYDKSSGTFPLKECSAASNACSYTLSYAPPNVYWMNTFFFNGGFAVKVSF